MKEIISYVEKAFDSIPDSSRKSEIMQEITQSLISSAEALMQSGKDREDAINKAIVDFGDLGEVLTELREDNDKKLPDKTALWFSIVASIIIISLLAFINFYYSPRYIWVIYPAFAVIWWPLSIFFFGKWRRAGK